MRAHCGPGIERNFIYLKLKKKIRKTAGSSSRVSLATGENVHKTPIKRAGILKRANAGNSPAECHEFLFFMFFFSLFLTEFCCKLRLETVNVSK